MEKNYILLCDDELFIIEEIPEFITRYFPHKNNEYTKCYQKDQVEELIDEKNSSATYLLQI